MNLLKISRGALEVREANSPLTEGELHLNTVFDNNTIYTLDEFGQKPFISLHTKVKDEIKKIATDNCLAVRDITVAQRTDFWDESNPESGFPFQENTLYRVSYTTEYLEENKYVVYRKNDELFFQSWYDYEKTSKEGVDKNFVHVFYLNTDDYFIDTVLSNGTKKRAWICSYLNPYDIYGNVVSIIRNGMTVIANGDVTDLTLRVDDVESDIEKLREAVKVLEAEKRSLSISNNPIEQRRKNKVDIGKPYISNSSLVYHFDTDYFDQYGTTPTPYELTGTYKIVDNSDFSYVDEIDLTPAMKSESPYSEISKSLYGEFVLNYPLTQSATKYIDFWANAKKNEYYVLLEYGNDSNKVRLEALYNEMSYNMPFGDEPPYSAYDDSVAYNAKSKDGLDYNIPLENEPMYIVSPDGEILYNIAFPFRFRIIIETNIGNDSHDIVETNITDFAAVIGEWVHIGLSDTENALVLYINNRKWELNADFEASYFIIGNNKTLLVDELLVDTTTVIDDESFYKSTEDRIPWAALDFNDKPIVLDANDVDNVKGNIVQLLEPTGKISMFMGRTAPKGYLLCDGSSWKISDYPELAKLLKDLPYNADTEEGYFKVPNMQLRFPMGAGILGNYIEPGLPNITGHFGNKSNAHHFLWGKDSTEEGAFTYDNIDGGTNIVDSLQAGFESYSGASFDASKGETKTDGSLKTDDEYRVYGKSDTVQPPAFTVNYIIKY